MFGVGTQICNSFGRDIWKNKIFPEDNFKPQLLNGGYNKRGMYYYSLPGKYEDGYSRVSQDFFYSDTCDYDCYVWCRTGKIRDAKVETIAIFGINGEVEWMPFTQIDSQICFKIGNRASGAYRCRAEYKTESGRHVKECGFVVK